VKPDNFFKFAVFHCYWFRSNLCNYNVNWRLVTCSIQTRSTQAIIISSMVVHRKVNSLSYFMSFVIAML